MLRLRASLTRVAAGQVARRTVPALSLSTLHSPATSAARSRPCQRLYRHFTTSHPLTTSSTFFSPTSSSSSSFSSLSPSTSTTSSTSATATVASQLPPLDLHVGRTYNNFTVQSITPIAEFNLLVYQLTHPTGALFIHVQRDDDDSAFSITFRTPPASSSGVAHILEHTALCGSARYPVRDPFFLLTRRSLKTYMNAMTAQDYTMYPFSSTLQKDYNNLMHVYLDSAFFPLLRRHDFMQEGHRLELEEGNKEGKEGKGEKGGEGGEAAGERLVVKGVVYNEMKGAMSDGGQLFSQRMQELVFSEPRNVYHHNSGGEPADIPNLTYEQLKDFHARYYQPSNACFFSYGRWQPPLEDVDKLVLSKFPHVQPINGEQRAGAPTYHPQPPITTPSTHQLTCPPDPLIANPLKQTKVASTWLLSGLSQLPADQFPQVSFAMSILSSLLLDGPMSPLYQALIESHIGNGYAPGTGYDGDSRQPTFSIGLQGVSDADVQRVSDVVESVLKERSESGFEAERVEAILHQLEVSVKHVGSHFGMGLMMRMMNSWAHEQDPTNPLHLNRKVDFIRQSMASDPHFFQRLIQQHILSNPGRVTLVMRPDAQYAAKENEREKAEVERKEAALTVEDKQRIREDATALKKQQDTLSDPTILPSLSVEDIKKTSEVITLTPLDIHPSPAISAVPTTPPQSAVLSATAGFAALTSEPTVSPSWPPVVFLEAATNGCAYVRLLFDMQSLPTHLRPYFPLFTSFLTEMGAGPFDYRQLSHMIDLYTGGISSSLRVFTSRTDLMQHSELLLFRGMALTRNVERLLQLFSHILVEPRWSDTERLKQLVVQTAASLSSSLQDSGHSYAKTYAAATLTPATFVNEEMGGITFVKRMNDIVKAVEAGDGTAVLSELGGRLMEISRHLLEHGMLRVMIVGDRTALDALERQLPGFLTNTSTSLVSPPLNGGLQTADSQLTSFTSQLNQRTFFALPIQVNHASLVLPTLPHSHPDTAPLTVAAKLMSSVFLHREIREKGGAYGGGSSHGDGLFSFYSYRDPNQLLTIDAFRRSIDWVGTAGVGGFSDSDVEEALLSLFSSIDAPTPPSSKGMNQFISGITWEERQRYRERLLATRRADVVRVAEQYLRGRDGNVCVVGDESKVPDELKSGKDGWRVERVQLSGQEELEGADESANEGETEDNEQQQRASQ